MFQNESKNIFIYQVKQFPPITITARLAQSVEHETLNLRVVGSSPTLGASFLQIYGIRSELVVLL